MATKRKSDGTKVMSNSMISELFSKLSLAASSNNYDQVLAISNDVLKTSPTDKRAVKQKTIALIKLDEYKKALAFLDECSFLKPADMILERGFCLYKLGRGEEAEIVLREGTGRGVLHARAQNVHSLYDDSYYRHTEWRDLQIP